MNAGGNRTRPPRVMLESILRTGLRKGFCPEGTS